MFRLSGGKGREEGCLEWFYTRKMFQFESANGGTVAFFGSRVHLIASQNVPAPMAESEMSYIGDISAASDA